MRSRALPIAALLLHMLTCPSRAFVPGIVGKKSLDDSFVPSSGRRLLETSFRARRGRMPRRTTVIPAEDSEGGDSSRGLKRGASGSILQFFHIFSAKLVLEVFGGAGAIWGFSEAVGLRVPSTVWFWRPCALAVGAVFFVRWLSQVQEYIQEEDVHLFSKDASSHEKEVALALQKEIVQS
ncbi:hypothetical protein ACHAWF_008764 [Thalassiosira exigua]